MREWAKRTGSDLTSTPPSSTFTTLASVNCGRAHSNAIPLSVTRLVSITVIPMPFPWNTNTVPSPCMTKSVTFVTGRKTLCGCGLSWLEM